MGDLKGDIGAHLSKKKEDKDGHFKVTVQTNEDKSKTHIKLKAYLGNEAENKYSHITTGITGLNPECSAVLSFSLNDKTPPDAALKDLKDSFEGLKQWLASISPEFDEIFNKMIKFQYTGGRSHILVTMTCDGHEFFDGLTDLTRGLRDVFEMGASLIVESHIGFKNDFGIIIRDKGKEKLLHSLFEGMRVQVEAKTKPNLIEIIRKKKYEGFEEFDDVLNYILLMIKTGHVTVNLQEMAAQKTEQFLEGIGCLEHYHATPSAHELRDLAKDADLEDLLKNHSAVLKFCNFMATHCKADTKFFVKGPHMLGMIEFETTGLREVYEYIMNKKA